MKRTSTNNKSLSEVSFDRNNKVILDARFGKSGSIYSVTTRWLIMSAIFSTMFLSVFEKRVSFGFEDEMEQIQIAKNKRGFELSKSGARFVPWGLNYDHRDDGKLIEEYWHDDWKSIEEDFEEMKALGANVIRIHLQFGAFMKSPNKPNLKSLEKLELLIKLAESKRLYLNLTGLGCYHKSGVPDWYDKLSEKERWDAQAEFWEAISKKCAGSPAIFCYDLMNEPVVPGNKARDDWLGGAFAGKHFVQFIALSAKGRERHEVAKQWISKLVAAIRKHDKKHLVTVGLVPWSLKQPGLYSGFDPMEISERLDFVSVHLYPEKGKLESALKTLEKFAAAGKPVVIEEIFTLKCDAVELEKFIDESKVHASGWIGFYWGKTLSEYQNEKTIQSAIVVSWLKLFQKKSASVAN